MDSRFCRVVLIKEISLELSREASWYFTSPWGHLKEKEQEKRSWDKIIRSRS